MLLDSSTRTQPLQGCMTVFLSRPTVCICQSPPRLHDLRRRYPILAERYLPLVHKAWELGTFHTMLNRCFAFLLCLSRYPHKGLPWMLTSTNPQRRLDHRVCLTFRSNKSTRRSVLLGRSFRSVCRRQPNQTSPTLRRCCHFSFRRP